MCHGLDGFIQVPALTPPRNLMDVPSTHSRGMLTTEPAPIRSRGPEWVKQLGHLPEEGSSLANCILNYL